MLVDEGERMTSFWGQYSPDTKQALFSDSVKLINEDYIIYSDTLKYNPNQNMPISWVLLVLCQTAVTCIPVKGGIIR